MNISTKIIITDTNIITDLNNAKVLKDFIKLDNVYICDLIRHDEINSATGDTNIINNFKVIKSTSEELAEINLVRAEKPQLSIYDALNYILARDNNGILATGDNELKKYSEKNGIKVIRTLKIIELMYENHIISYTQTLDACKLLKDCPTTRIPTESIDDMIQELEKETVNAWHIKSW